MRQEKSDHPNKPVQSEFQRVYFTINTHDCLNSETNLVSRIRIAAIFLQKNLMLISKNTCQSIQNEGIM
jgi:hypothetical protein